MSNLFVCLMGVGTVFFGLVSLVFICYILSAVCKLIPGKKTQAAPKANMASNAGAEIANKGEIVAAACAVIAHELGEDVKNIRVVSFKKA